MEIRERNLEDLLIETLSGLKYDYRPDIRDRATARIQLPGKVRSAQPGHAD